MIRTICSLLASFHFQGLAFGARKHTMETYGGHATHCQRTTCRDNKRLIDLRLIDMKANLPMSGDTHEIHVCQMFQLRYVGK